VSYSHFKASWRQHRVSLIYSLLGEDESKERFMQHLFKHVIDCLVSAPSVEQRIWHVYTLYTLHQCQVTERKYKIILPQTLWPFLLSCSHEFMILPISDASHVLDRMVSLNVFEWHADDPLSDELEEKMIMVGGGMAARHRPKAAISYASATNRLGYGAPPLPTPSPHNDERELSTAAKTAATQGRAVKQRRYLHDLSPNDIPPATLFDLTSQLQLSQLRQQNRMYAQAMQAMQHREHERDSAEGNTGGGVNPVDDSGDDGAPTSAVGSSLQHLPFSNQLPSDRLIQRVEQAIAAQQKLIQSMQTMQKQPHAAHLSTSNLAHPDIASSSSSSSSSNRMGTSVSFSLHDSSASASSDHSSLILTPQQLRAMLLNPAPYVLPTTLPSSASAVASTASSSTGTNATFQPGPAEARQHQQPHSEAVTQPIATIPYTAEATSSPRLHASSSSSSSSSPSSSARVSAGVNSADDPVSMESTPYLQPQTESQSQTQTQFQSQSQSRPSISPDDVMRAVMQANMQSSAQAQTNAAQG